MLGLGLELGLECCRSTSKNGGIYRTGTNSVAFSFLILDRGSYVPLICASERRGSVDAISITLLSVNDYRINPVRYLIPVRTST